MRREKYDPFGTGKQKASKKMALEIEIVDLPMNSMVMFHSYVATSTEGN